MISNLANVSVRQLEQAVKIKSKLEILQARLDEILGSAGTEGPTPISGKRRLSAAGRAAIAAGARKRWARARGETGESATANKPRRKMSAAAKARMSAV